MTELNSQQVAGLVERALERAASRELELRSPRSLVYMRSRAFCGALAEELRGLYPAEQGYAVFAGRDQANRANFGRQELMGDVSVYAVDEIPAGHYGSGNAYLKSALWMIESEFDASPKAALRDFIKFVAGSAAQKLFVAPQTKAGERVLESLAFPARYSGGDNYVAFVPHPRTWNEPHKGSGSGKQAGGYHSGRPVRSNPRMQPTGRGGPTLRLGTGLLVAKQWKR